MDEPAWVIPQPPEELPSVTVVIPSHRPALLAEALESIRAQTLPRREIQVLVNDSPVWYGDKVNDLISVARAPLFSVLCDDDKVKPTYYARMLDAIRGFDFAFSDIQLFGDEDRVYPLPEFGLNTFRAAVSPWWTFVMRKSLWEQLGGFDPKQTFQDTEFLVRVAKAGARAAHVREPLHCARVHAANGGKHMDASAAMLSLQAAHPDVYPSAYVDPEGVKHSRNPFDHVQRVFVPPRFQESA
jgi:cellulose synthase/poly-beta-1,6-N-acetylglucosamine synthase-like glycosyltransferase